jgi:hypothetical protein
VANGRDVNDVRRYEEAVAIKVAKVLRAKTYLLAMSNFGSLHHKFEVSIQTK